MKKDNMFIFNSKSPEELMKKYGKNVANQLVVELKNRVRVYLHESKIKIIFTGVNSLKNALKIEEGIRKNINDIEEKINNETMSGIIELEDKLTHLKWIYENNKLIINVE